MANRACVLPIAVTDSSMDPNRIDIQVNGVILGNGIGTFPGREFGFRVENLDPPSLSTLYLQIEAAVKAHLEAGGVTFAVNDTVLVI